MRQEEYLRSKRNAIIVLALRKVNNVVFFIENLILVQGER